MQLRSLFFWAFAPSIGLARAGLRRASPHGRTAATSQDVEVVRSHARLPKPTSRRRRLATEAKAKAAEDKKRSNRQGEGCRRAEAGSQDQGRRGSQARRQGEGRRGQGSRPSRQGGRRSRSGKAKAAEASKLAAARQGQGRGSQEAGDSQGGRGSSELTPGQAADAARQAEPVGVDGRRADRQQWRIAQRDDGRCRSVGLVRRPVRRRIRRRACCPKPARSTPRSSRSRPSKKFKVKPEFEPQVVAVLRLSARHHRHRYRLRTSSISSNRPRRARRYAHRRRPGRPAVQGHGQGRRQAGMAALDPDARRCRSASRRNTASTRTACPAAADNPLGARAIYLYQGKKDTHLRIHGTIAAADDRHQLVQRLLPHDQRARHGPLQPREGRHPGRRPLTACAQSRRKGRLCAGLFCLPSSSIASGPGGKTPRAGFFLWRNQIRPR